MGDVDNYTQEAIDIMYENELPLRGDFKQKQGIIIEFMNNNIRKHDDVDKIFFIFISICISFIAEKAKWNI